MGTPTPTSSAADFNLNEFSDSVLSKVLLFFRKYMKAHPEMKVRREGEVETTLEEQELEPARKGEDELKAICVLEALMLRLEGLELQLEKMIEKAKASELKLKKIEASVLRFEEKVEFLELQLEKTAEEAKVSELELKRIEGLVLEMKKILSGGVHARGESEAPKVCDPSTLEGQRVGAVLRLKRSHIRDDLEAGDFVEIIAHMQGHSTVRSLRHGCVVCDVPWNVFFDDQSLASSISDPATLAGQTCGALLVIKQQTEVA